MLTLDEGKRLSLLDSIQAERCRRSFYYFVQTFWETIDPEPLLLNWHMQFICNHMQRVAEGVFRREKSPYDLVINVSPGSSKSTIVTVMFPAWCWTRMASSRFICSSYAYPLSLALSVRCRDVVKSEKYKRLFPSLGIREGKGSKGYFGNSHGGDRYSTSTEGSVTGFHGHFIIVDDPLDPHGVRSELELHGCNRWFSEILSSRKVDKEIAVTIIVMQRLGIGDLTDYVLSRDLEKSPIKHICLPCDDSWEIKPACLKKKYSEKGGLMDPVRLSRATLDKFKEQLGPREYAGQFGQAPRAAEGNMFSRDKFTVVLAPPSKVVKKLRYFDKAGTEGGTGSQTAGVLLGLMENRKWIVLDCIAGRWEAEKRERIILNTAIADGLETEVVFEQEPGSGGKESAENTFKKLAGFKRRADRVTGDKIVRAEPWSIEVMGGGVCLLKGSWNLPYIAEHEDFPQGKIKDRVDASSGAYAHLAKLVRNKRKHGGGW